eukprot:c22933_g1_i1 orf=509-1333(-)
MARCTLLRFLLVLCLASAFLSSPFFVKISALAQDDEQDVADIVDDITSEAGDSEVGLVGEGIEDRFDSDHQPAAGVETVVYFPKHPDRIVLAGEPSEILVGIGNYGDSPLKVHSIRASLHLPFDHSLYVQNFTVLEIVNAIVHPLVQASFAYSFTTNKYLQPGGFALVASIMYEVDDQLHRSVFYNGTLEVAEAGGFFSGETLFLITLGLGLLGLCGMWIYGQFQRLSKKTRTKKVETGTRSAETVNNEWLQGTAFTRKLSRSLAQPTKSKKKK